MLGFYNTLRMCQMGVTEFVFFSEYPYDPPLIRYAECTMDCPSSDAYLV